MHKILLHENWTLRPVGDLAAVPAPLHAVLRQGIRAVVPGCVHTDLLAAGLIPDPYLAMNENEVQWIGELDWQYACTFTVDAATLAYGQIDLVCMGLDTIATVALNGQVLGHTANMHLAHRFSARSALRSGSNELAITFASAPRYARGMEEKLGLRPHTTAAPFNFIRKMACNFGWDWGPSLATAGIWQPIYLQTWNTARLESVKPLVIRAAATHARLDLHVGLAQISPAQAPAALQVTLTDPAGQTVVSATAPAHTAALLVPLEIPQPQLWWPRGYGAQPLYELTVLLWDEHGDELDRWSHRVGLRTVQLDTAPDAIGSRFIIQVNGRDVFCKGANWIPDDCFLPRVTPERYRQRLEQAVVMNMNTLRVWGGGIYESDVFYDICDELGILIWQDFLFACAAYAEEPPFPELIEAEARANIVRLSRHPSLVLWNGNNECIWGYLDWGWRHLLTEQTTWGKGYYLDLLPRLVKELDPSRPYWPGSPYSGSMDIPPLDDRHGNKHVWDVWNKEDYGVYRKHSPRFVSEFGWQAPPTAATLFRAVPPDERATDSTVLVHHNKQLDGTTRLSTRLKEHFHLPENFDDWMYLTQVNQARAVQAAVEWWRSRHPVCMGMLYWQINDCWPVCSWAAVDGDGRWKPLAFATRRFFADRILTIQPEPDGALWLYAHNDTDQLWTTDARLERRAFTGEHLAHAGVALTVPPRSGRKVAALTPLLGAPADATREFLLACADATRAFWYFEIDKNLHYPTPAFSAKLRGDGTTHYLTLTAETFLRDLAVFPDRLDPDATVSDQLVTLLPGETVTFVLHASGEPTLDQLTHPPILQCVNRFGSPQAPSRFVP